MSDQNLNNKILAMTRGDGRYRIQAYHFILDSLDYVSATLGKTRLAGPDRHVSVDEMLDGVKEYAMQQFGPLAKVVLEYFGIYSTEDIGEIVFDFVNVGLLNKQESDRREDFSKGFDFREVFEESYTPEVPW